MTHRTRAQERIDQLDTSRAAEGSAAAGTPASPAPNAEQLQDELAATQAKADEYLAALQRERAEFQNFKRRAGEERERELGLASESLLRKLLALADDFDRALEQLPGSLRAETWVEGIVAIDRKLRQTLESEGLSPIEAVGHPFDPREHEAVATVPGTGEPEGHVVAEVRRGYRLRDRILRPAMVAVSAGPEGAADGGSRDDRSPGPGASDRGRGDLPN